MSIGLRLRLYGFQVAKWEKYVYPLDVSQSILSDFRMFPLRYNFTLRFLMWKTKGGNHKGLPPLEFSPFGKPLSLTPLLRLRWRKSAVLACRLRIAALAQAPCSRNTVCGLQRLATQTFFPFKLPSLRSTAFFVFSFYYNSTFHFPHSKFY